MADKRWTPRQLPVAELDTLTIANTWAAADTATVTINSKPLVLTVGTLVTTAQVAQSISEMMSGTTFTDTTAAASETGNEVGEFQELTETVVGSVVRVLGEKGKPFTMTASEVTAGSGTVTQAVSIAANGPNFWDSVNNWGASAIPADADVIFLDNSDVDILYGLLQSAIEPAAMYIAMSYTGQIGLPETNQDGTPYLEYRPQYLQIGPLILEIGAGVGTGSGRIKIDSTSDPCALTVLNSGSSIDELPAIIWKGTNAGNTLVMYGGTLGIAIFGSEVATLATFVVNGGVLTLGAGVTLSGALVVNGGTVTINSAIAGSLTVNGGQVTINGTGAVAQLTIRSGRVIYNTNGTLGGATIVSGDGVLDFGEDSRTLTVTNRIDIYGLNSRIIDPNKRLGAIVIDANEGADAGTQVIWGTNYSLARGSTA
jgi:hypothetical protein